MNSAVTVQLEDLIKSYQHNYETAENLAVETVILEEIPLCNFLRNVSKSFLLKVVKNVNLIQDPLERVLHLYLVMDFLICAFQENSSLQIFSNKNDRQTIQLVSAMSQCWTKFFQFLLRDLPESQHETIISFVRRKEEQLQKYNLSIYFKGVAEFGEKVSRGIQESSQVLKAKNHSILLADKNFNNVSNKMQTDIVKIDDKIDDISTLFANIPEKNNLKKSKVNKMKCDITRFITDFNSEEPKIKAVTQKTVSQSDVVLSVNKSTADKPNKENGYMQIPEEKKADETSAYKKKKTDITSFMPDYKSNKKENVFHEKIETMKIVPAKKNAFEILMSHRKNSRSNKSS